MTDRRRINRNVVWVLIVGFSLTIVLLLVSGLAGIRAIEIAEERGFVVLEQHRMSARWIDEIQGEEAGLSSIFYALVTSPDGGDRETLFSQLTSYEAAVARTLDAARSGPEGEQWARTAAAVKAFGDELRRALRQPAGAPMPATLYRAHEAFVGAIAGLVAANYELSVEAEESLGAAAREQMRHSLSLLALGLLLSIVCALATSAVVIRMFRRIEWQTRELLRLSGHVIEAQEDWLRRFSRELHDEFGQVLTAIEANLAAVPRTSDETAARLEDCSLLVQDAMANVRELSQLLRPSMLDDFGLGPSLQWLVETFSQRTGIAVDVSLELDGRLPSEIETHLFRIAQEALTNAARHSGATRVTLQLTRRPDAFRLSIRDDGRGITEPANGHGIGLVGMRERMAALGGRFEIHSRGDGLALVAEIPIDGTA